MGDRRDVSLSFPLGGVSRRLGYRDTSRPYVSPWAINVRGVGALEDRERGGSRPGFVKAHAPRFHDGTGSVTAICPARIIDGDGVRRHELYVIANGSFYAIRGAVTVRLGAALTTDGLESILTDDGQEIVFDSEVSEVTPLGDCGGFEAAFLGNRLYLLI